MSLGFIVCIFFVGTTAQKELHSVAEAEAFTGHWHTSSSGAVLFAYYMSFDIHPVEDEMHANFVLLIGAALDDDVSKLEIELCLTRGRKAKAKLSPLGRTTLTADQVSGISPYCMCFEEGLVINIALTLNVQFKMILDCSDSSEYLGSSFQMFKDYIHLLYCIVIVNSQSLTSFILFGKR